MYVSYLLCINPFLFGGANIEPSIEFTTAQKKFFFPDPEILKSSKF